MTDNLSGSTIDQVNAMPPALAEGTTPQTPTAQDPTLTALNSIPVSQPQMAAPDVTQAVSNNMAQNVSNPAPDAAQPQPRFWQRILMGALTGLAGAAGAKTFGAGLGMGAAGS